jgi:hypothetical protein
MSQLDSMCNNGENKKADGDDKVVQAEKAYYQYVRAALLSEHI